MAREKAPRIDTLPPRENPLLFGHEATEQRFLREFASGRSHHAYLISGPAGIGKATLAYRMARFALEQCSATAEAPSLSLFSEPEPAAATRDSLFLPAEDALFRRVASGSHSDLRVLAPTDENKKPIITVDAARKIPEFLNLTPAEGEWRVVIIDSADDLNPNAANALLKTIEEPPARAIILLISHQPGGLLPTIRSRCRHYTLAAPDAAAFAETLQHVAPAIPHDDYGALYALSHGSPGYAITLHAEDGLKWYQGWLTAMRPHATPEERLRFADSAAQQKSSEAWNAVLHGWRTAMHRLTLHPHRAPAIAGWEGAALNALAEATAPALRRTWQEQGERLLADTDIFNLDKRQTIRLLLDAAQLDRLAA